MVHERSSKNIFWSIKNSLDILDKLKARDFSVSSVSTYFFVLFTLHRKTLFTLEKPKKFHAWSCQNVCDALTVLLGIKVYPCRFII